jgi:hypothetical protein
LIPVPFGNDPAKIERYRAFWNRQDTSRPLVGLTFKTWFPRNEYRASAEWPSGCLLTPDMIDPPAFLPDEEHFLREGEARHDDLIRGASPSQAIPWLDGMLGAQLHVLPGSILAEEQHLSWDELDEIRLDRANPWLHKYIEWVDALVDSSRGRFPVAHGTLPGPSDLAGTLRGRTQIIDDLIEEPERAVRLLRRLAGITRELNDEVWQRVPLFCGGYFDAEYQLWSPAPLFRMQEDATALYSPRLYRALLQAIDRQLAAEYACSFIHLHSTSMFILNDLLAIEELRGFQVNNDVGGPPIKTMLPYFQTIQRADRPLIIRGSFSTEDIRLLMDTLEPKGLFMYVMVKSMQEAHELRPSLIT